eukprot:COSAG05_NODE_1866_length_3934_cov_1.989048_1_plen_191_part_00
MAECLSAARRPYYAPPTRRRCQPAAASCLPPPRATQQTTQKPTSASPRTCRTAPVVLLRAEDVPRTSLSAGRRRATLIRQAAPSSRAKATIGQVRCVGIDRRVGARVLARSKSEHADTANLHAAAPLQRESEGLSAAAAADGDANDGATLPAALRTCGAVANQLGTWRPSYTGAYWNDVLLASFPTHAQH